LFLIIFVNFPVCFVYFSVFLAYFGGSGGVLWLDILGGSPVHVFQGSVLERHDLHRVALAGSYNP